MESGGEKLFELGARLSACADFVRRGRIPADIGTDHAYLPIWLVQTGRVPAAFASDINEEPIRSAIKNIESHGLSEKIKTFTADGLESIPPHEVDDIIIAGMGGDNISAILSGGEWLKNRRYRLILQPMSRASRLREYLFTNGFDIIGEKAICEAGRLYTVICAEYRGAAVVYDDSDIYKQAEILLSMAEGCAAKDDYSGQAHYIRLAEQLIESIQGGISNDKGKGSI